jgi:hypothetical protein
MHALNKNLEMYVMMYANCMQYIAHAAYEWAKKRKETGGPLYGLFTQGCRPVIMLAAPGGPNTCHETAHFAMDHEYVTCLNQYMLDVFGLQYIGDWHLHIIDMDHLSGGDVKHINQLASRENLQTMVQLLFTCPKLRLPNEMATRFSKVKEKLPADRENRSKVKVSAFIYEKAASGSYRPCRIKYMLDESPIRKALSDTDILVMPGKPRLEKFPFERIIYDEVRAVSGTATEQYIPHILTKQLSELSDEIARRAEVCIDNKGQIVLSLPLPNKHRLSLSYEAKTSPPKICSVSVFFQDMKTVIDLTNEILANNDHITLSLIHRCVEDKIRASGIKRITPFIVGRRYFAAKFHKTKKFNE